MFQVNTIANALSDRFVDLFEFEFEGRDTLERECKRVSDAVTEAEEAAFNVGAFVLPPQAAVRLRDDLIKTRGGCGGWQAVPGGGSTARGAGRLDQVCVGGDCQAARGSG